jgi:hypothetical protein
LKLAELGLGHGHPPVERARPDHDSRSNGRTFLYSGISKNYLPHHAAHGELSHPQG